MDDLAKVALEVSRGELLKVGQGGRRNVTLPLQVALASVNESSQVGVLLHEGGKRDEVVVLVDVVHDLDLEESLGCVVHDLVGQLGLGDVLPELLDAVASGLGGSVLVDHLVTLVLRLLATLQLLEQGQDNREFTSEERIL